jgi:hypothetical protein
MKPKVVGGRQRDVRARASASRVMSHHAFSAESTRIGQ